jgi:hypothetical protein
MSEPETDAIIAEYASAPSPTLAAAIDAVVVALKGTAATTGTLWDSLEALWVPGCGNDVASSRLDWKNPSGGHRLNYHVGAVDGGLTFLAGYGIKGTGLGFGSDGSHAVTGIMPAAGGFTFSQDDIGLFQFFTQASADAANDNYQGFSHATAGQIILISWRSTGTGFATRLCTTTTLQFSNADVASRTGARGVERVGNQVSGWLNGLSAGASIANASQALVNGPAGITLLGGPGVISNPDTLGTAAIFRAVGDSAQKALSDAFYACFISLGSWPPPPPAATTYNGDAIDLTLDGGIAGSGKAFLRNVTTSDFDHLGVRDFNGGGIQLPGTGTYALEISDSQIYSLFGNGTGMVPLVPEFPFAEPAWYDSGDPTKWNVLSAPHSTSGLLDATAAIQAGLDSAAEVVVLPPGRYYINDTLLLRGTTKKFLCIGSQLFILSNTTNNWNDPLNPRPLLRFTSTTTDCVIDNLDNGGSTNAGIGGTLGFICVEHASPRDLVIRDSATFQVNKYVGYRNTPAGTGKIFLHNTAFGMIEIHNQRLWARNLNLETSILPLGRSRFVNDGGEAWIFSYKTEFKGILCKATNGSKTAIYGGFFYPNQAFADGDDPMFDITNSQFSASWVEMVFTANRTYQTLVKETVGAETRTLLKAQVPTRGSGSAVMLYSNV